MAKSMILQLLLLQCCIYELHCQVCNPPPGYPTCVCQTTQGLIDLTSIASRNGPLFSNVPDSRGRVYDYNPCYGFQGQYGECAQNGIAVCQTARNGCTLMCGTVASETFYIERSNRYLQYGHGQGGRMSIVKLICDPTAEVPQLVAHGDITELTYEFDLRSKCACPGGCSGPAPEPGSSSSSNKDGPIGIVLIVTFVVGIVIAGALLLKFKYKKTGYNIIPQRQFWFALLGLIKEQVDSEYSKLQKEFVSIMTYRDERVGFVVIFDVNDKKTGTRIDVEKVKDTFRDLNYAIWVVKNTTPSKMKNAAKIISKYKDYPIEYKWIVVYYAGHGGISKDNNKGFFWFHDQKEPIPFENVTEPLQPGYEGCCLANRKRLFLFDCCLTESQISVKTDQILTNRDDLPSFMPSHDFTIIAYATYLRAPASGSPSKGGKWTGVLCNNIKKYASLKKVNEILELTRNEVIRDTTKLVSDKRPQGPHFTSIGGDGYLVDRVTNPPLQDSQPVEPKPPVSDEVEEVIDIETIMSAIPDKSDLMIVLDGIKDDEKKWRDYFGKRLLRDANQSDAWFRNFLKLEFLIDEITGENIDNYIYTWRTIINSLDKPTRIKFGKPKTGVKDISDVVRDHLSKPDIFSKYKAQVN